MSTLAQLRDRVEADLRDTGNNNWSTDEIDAHLRSALVDYNAVDPRRAQAALDDVADTREYSLDTIHASTPILELYDVWWPYDSSDPAHPPERPRWALIAERTLYLDVDDAPAGEYQLRLFYTTPRTIDDLDGATGTTLSAEAENLVVLGATAYAGLQYAQSLINTVTASGWTPQQLREWAEVRLAQFRAGLEDVRRRAVLMQDPRVAWAAASRDEGRGGVV